MSNTTNAAAQTLYVIRTTAGQLVQADGKVTAYLSKADAKEAARYIKTPTEVVEFIPFRV